MIPFVDAPAFAAVLASADVSTLATVLASPGVPAFAEVLANRYAYVLFALLLGVGLYVMVASPNFVKKLIGLNLFQTALFLLFIASAYVVGGQAPVLHGHGAGDATYVSPLPHVLVLTAIVVGVALTAVALALLVRIYAEYGTLQEDVLREVRADE